MSDEPTGLIGELRKSAQEVEIDRLLAEEFVCDDLFGPRFLASCGLPYDDFRVTRVISEPSLGGEGFGDLLVEGETAAGRIALLIEDKITAGPAVRQAERYAAHAQRLRVQNWPVVLTVLVAPSAYHGERGRFDASIDLEIVSSLLDCKEPKRLAYRRAIIARALRKSNASGVQVPDPILHQLKSDYFAFAKTFCVEHNLPLSFPPLAPSYYDGSSWVEQIRDPRLPARFMLRHRLWTRNDGKTPGQVDLISNPASISDRTRFAKHGLVDAISSPYSNDRGVQLSIRVPQMRQSTGFSPTTAHMALMTMTTLVDWALSFPASE